MHAAHSRIAQTPDLDAPAIRPLAGMALQQPWVRKTAKALYRLTHARDSRHSIELWPWLRLEHDPQERLIAVSIAGTRYAGECPTRQHPLSALPLHLVATGPSVRNLQGSQLHGGVLMGVNGAIALCEREAIRFSLYVIVDYTFITARPDLVRRIVRQPDLLLYTTPKCLFYLHRLIGQADIRCRLAFFEDVAEQYNKPTHASLAAAALQPALHSHGRLGFSTDIAMGVFRGGTVAFAGLQIAAAIGFRTITLHGVDIGNADQPRFYETAEDRQKSHLAEEYAATIEPSFRLGCALLRQKGIRLCNASAQSILPRAWFDPCPPDTSLALEWAPATCPDTSDDDPARCPS